MSGKLSAKAAATAALLGEPVSSSAATAGGEAPKKKKVKKEDGIGLASAVPLDKQLVKLLAAAPKGLSQDEVCHALNVSPSDLLDPINELLGRVRRQAARVHTEAEGVRHGTTTYHHSDSLLLLPPFCCPPPSTASSF